MEKKQYISPTIAVIELAGECQLLAGSDHLGEETDHGSCAAPAYRGAWDLDEQDEE